MDNWINFPKKDLVLKIDFSEENMEDETLLFWNEIKTSPKYGNVMMLLRIIFGCCFM